MRLVEHEGQALSAQEWSRQPHQRELGLSAYAIRERVRKGWSPAEALTVQAGARSREAGPAPVAPNTPYDHDVAAQLMVTATGGATLEQVATALGLTRERVRQIEAAALMKLRKRAPLVRLSREAIEHRHVSTGRHDPAPAPRRAVVAPPEPAPEPVLEEGLQSSPWRELEEAIVRGTKAAEALIAVLDELHPMAVAS